MQWIVYFPQKNIHAPEGFMEAHLRGRKGDGHLLFVRYRCRQSPNIGKDRLPGFRYTQSPGPLTACCRSTGRLSQRHIKALSASTMIHTSALLHPSWSSHRIFASPSIDSPPELYFLTQVTSRTSCAEILPLIFDQVVSSCCSICLRSCRGEDAVN